MQSLYHEGVCAGGGLFGGAPELFLRRVAVHRTDAEQAVAELLRRVLEVAGVRLYHAAVVHQPEGEAGQVRSGHQIRQRQVGGTG